MTSKSDLLTNALIDYINDVKPYHTKFRDVTSQIYFNDSFNVNLKESYQFTGTLQDLWTRDDMGGYLLSNLSEGSFASDPIFTGSGSGKITGIKLISANYVESWTLTATTSTTFTVVGSVSGSQVPAVVGTQYVHDNMTFTISAGLAPYAIGDTFTFTVSGDHSYPIPATVFPRFSLTDNVGQTPVGDDAYSINSPTDFATAAASPHQPAEYTDSHQSWASMVPVAAIVIEAIQNGLYFQITIDTLAESTFGFDPTAVQISINGVAWLGGISNPSPGVYTILTTVPGLAPRVEVLYLLTGRYAVPYHQGSRVKVNGVPQVFGVDYVVDNTRSFIQFLTPSPTNLTNHFSPTVSQGWPTSGVIDINLFRSDRLFICWQDPFAFGLTPDVFTVSVQAAPAIIQAGAGNFVLGETYTILETNGTNFTLIGCPQLIPGDNFGHDFAHNVNGFPGNVFTMSSGPLFTAGTLVTGKSYTIESQGTTDFTLVGAANNNGGTIFIATGPGSGAGTASANYDTSTGFGLAAPQALMDISITPDQVLAGHQYTVLVPDPNLLLIAASWSGTPNTVGSAFVASDSGLEIAGSFSIGASYIIKSVGDTDFTTIGAVVNEIGFPFIATGVGVGNGTAALSGPGVVAPTKVCNITFTNTQFGTNKATMQNASVYYTANVGDVWTVTATAPWTFKVQKTTPHSSTTTVANFKSRYDDGVLSFTIDRTYLDYYVTMMQDYTCYLITQDTNSYIGFDDLPLDTLDEYDPSEFFANVVPGVTTEHGVLGNVNSLAPVRFEPLGSVIKNPADTSGTQEYIFKFDKIPPAFTYIEFQVGQEGQYNPWINASIEEAAYIIVTYQDTMTSEVITLTGTTFPPPIAPSIPNMLGSMILPASLTTPGP